MATFKITVAYDGTDYVGWQRQANGVSIQGLIEDALRELEGRHVPVAGAGRTDAGVHALGQVAGFTIARAIGPEALVRALNAHLPPAIRIVHAEETAAAFHPRFGARQKTYRYQLWNRDVLSPFERGYAWHVPGPLDIDAMNAAAGRLVGRHDFAAFQAAGSSVATTEREIFSSRIIPGPEPCATGEDTGSIAALKRRSTSIESGAGPVAETGSGAALAAETGSGAGVVAATSSGAGLVAATSSGAGLQPCGPLIVYEVSGAGFLRHMVRTIVGSLVEVGRGRRPIDWISEIVASRDRSAAGPTAPPHGLFLVNVTYAGALAAGS